MDDERLNAMTTAHAEIAGRRRALTGLLAGAAAILGTTTASAANKRRKKRRRRRKRRESRQGCPAACGSTCDFCFTRAEGPPLCGNGRHLNCLDPVCTSDNDCVASDRPYCLTHSHFLGSVQPHCADGRGRCTAITLACGGTIES